MSDEGDFTLATITITKTLTEDDIVVGVSAVTPDGENLPIIDSLGMIELAKDTLLNSRWDDEDEL